MEYVKKNVAGYLTAEGTWSTWRGLVFCCFGLGLVFFTLWFLVDCLGLVLGFFPNIYAVPSVVLISWLSFQYIFVCSYWVPDSSPVLHHFSNVTTNDWEGTSIASYVIKDSFSVWDLYLRGRRMPTDNNNQTVWPNR